MPKNVLHIFGGKMLAAQAYRLAKEYEMMQLGPLFVAIAALADRGALSMPSPIILRDNEIEVLKKLGYSVVDGTISWDLT